MSVLADVLREARAGGTTAHIAARLGLDPGLAEAAIDHWVRLGVVARCGGTPGAAGPCGGCAPAVGSAAGCAGCVFARR